jgi:hypothetical protein
MRLFALLPLLTLALSAQAAPSAREAAQKIDTILQADWKKANVRGNPAADDNTFVRRIYLDTIGRIPTTREVEDFVKSTEGDKRAKLIDKLLASEAYVQHMYNYWADVLRLTSNGGQTGGITGSAYLSFVKESLRSNKPYDQFVRDMVGAQGRAWETGAIGYYMRDRGMPLDNMANTVRIFLGTRIECAQCHNHPFDKWSQMQFFKMAAFTYGIETQDYYGGVIGEVRDILKSEEDELREKFPEPQRPKYDKKMSSEERHKLDVAFDNQRKAVRKAYDDARNALRKEHSSLQEPINDIRDTMRYTSVGMRDRKLALPHDYQYTDAKPKSVVSAGTMMGHECITLPGETPLQAYARWMTSRENPRFTTVIASRLWKKAFGLALIEPLDELMDGTIPMIPELQTYLEGLMKDLNYDMKAYQRVLFNTSAYQRQVTREEVAPGVAYHFTGPVLRRMTAEQMWDSFVTLLNPNPDMINSAARDQMEQRILQARKNADGLEALSVDQAFRGLKMAGEVYSKNRERTDGKQKEYLEARNAQKEIQDKLDAMKPGPDREALAAKAAEARKKVDSIRSEVNALQNEGRKLTVSEVIVPGHKKLYEKVTGKPYQTVSMAKNSTADGAEVPSMMAGESMMMMPNGIRAERVNVPGYDRKELTKEERQAEEEQRMVTYREEANFYGIPEKQLKDYARARNDQVRKYLRAAELSSSA